MLAQLGRHLGGAQVALQLRQKHQEPISAHGSERVALPQRVLEPDGHLAQHLVAAGVAQQLVDPLEPVHVQEQHADRVAFAHGLEQRVLEAVGEAHMIGQSGAGVHQALLRKLGFQVLDPGFRLAEPADGMKALDLSQEGPQPRHARVRVQQEGSVGSPKWYSIAFIDSNYR
jgi:hypothetical protein